ncbi:cryptochrome/photolyase family protein [Desertibaculum subflavum]|uniref:cryptochrome/photolyase family protein n=1 Tax=Desertibaculum subflavum TaxID=2268458 RepID=UPI000E661D85
MQQTTIVWFREDLRLADNPALTAAAARGAVLPVYILEGGAGGAGRWWLHHSLAALADSFAARGVPLVLRRGDPMQALSELARESGAGVIAWNASTLPDRRAADRTLRSGLAAQGVAVEEHAADFLFAPDRLRTRAGEPFSVFTPFWKACLAQPEPARPLPAPRELRRADKPVASHALSDWKLCPTKPDWAAEFDEWWTPGEAGAHARAKAFLDSALPTYGAERDRPDRAGVSRLSPHLHFGEVTARQIWHAVRRREIADGHVAGAEAYLREVGWREFSRHLLLRHPDLPERALKPEFDSLPWRHDPAGLRAWQKGLTGYPIVDAGMRELWRIGWMHNRVRMVVASFLIKHLLIDWREGAAWFMDTLVDADLANNSASWQWVAGCGADAAPYFRIFNPVLQGEKFDPEGDYVRRWVPELARLHAQWIHRPWEAPRAVLEHAGIRLGHTYPHPIVDHAAGRARALAAFGSVKEAA